jgi:uncharacterized protein YjbI with pentapeptide repeats
MKLPITPLVALAAFALPCFGTPTPEQSPAREVVREFHSNKDFSNQDLAGTKFFQARMNGTTFAKSRLASVVFDQCDLAGSDFRDAVFAPDTVLTRATANDANFENVDFAMSTIDSVNFKGANLKGAKNFGSLDRADFRRADLRGADFSTAQLPLEGVLWEGAIFDASTKFPSGITPDAVGAVESK